MINEHVLFWVVAAFSAACVGYVAYAWFAPRGRPTLTEYDVDLSDLTDAEEVSETDLITPPRPLRLQTLVSAERLAHVRRLVVPDEFLDDELSDPISAGDLPPLPLPPPVPSFDEDDGQT